MAGSSSASWSLFSSPLQIVVDSRNTKIKAVPAILIFWLGAWLLLDDWNVEAGRSFECLLSVRLVNFNMYHMVFSQKKKSLHFSISVSGTLAETQLFRKKIVKRQWDLTEAIFFTYLLFQWRNRCSWFSDRKHGRQSASYFWKRGKNCQNTGQKWP